MTAGMNLRLRVWRMEMDADDAVGGAMVTGTPNYDWVGARMEMARPDLLLLQQGLETEKIYTVLVHPANLDIRERDEVEVVFPPHHPFLHERFRVRGVQYPSTHIDESRGYLLLYVSRSEIAHGTLY